MHRPSHLRRNRRHARGQALAEFAFVAMILLTLFATVVDLGRLFYATITLENAARAGALQAAVTPASFTSGPCNYTTNEIGCVIENESNGSGVTVAANQITVTCYDESGAVQPCPSSPKEDWRTQVAVAGTFTLLTPILQPFVGGPSLNLSAAVYADQQALPSPNPNTPSPSPTSTPVPTASPSPSPTPSATTTPSPSPSPTPSPIPSPCPSGQAPVPDLVVGAGGAGTTETVAQARVEWQTAGFSLSNFNPSSGHTTAIVTGQSVAAGTCQLTTITITVTYQ